MASKIRQFRHQVAVLKKKGLVTRVDARKAQPTARLKEALQKYRKVLSGEAAAVKLSKEETKRFKESGYTVAAPKGGSKRVIIPKMSEEKVTVSHGRVSIKHPSGITRVQIPVDYRNLPKFLNDLKKNSKQINGMKKRGEYFAYKFYGHNSRGIFRSIEAMVAEWEDGVSAGLTMLNAINARDPKAMADIYQNLEIVRVPKYENWRFPTEAQRAAQNEYDRKKYRRREAKLKRGPQFKLDDDRATKAAAQKAIRDERKKDGGAEYEAYKAAARKRAKKSAKKEKVTTKKKAAAKKAAAKKKGKK